MAPSENTVTGDLCKWICGLELAQIPPHVIERAKYIILDGIGCALVAAHLPWSETAVKAVMKMEPSASCTIIGWEMGLPPLAATLLNSTFVQGFELDDYHSRAPVHLNSLLLPALLAATETRDSATSGADLIKAYVAGSEVGPRVGLALHGRELLSRGWHSGAVQGPSASAAAIASLLNLSEQQTEWALGIACTQACGLMSAQYGSMAKRMQHGFAARNGLFACLMAQEDYTGIEQVYDQPYGGFLSCFSQGSSHTPASLPEEVRKELGERWELLGTTVKLHAAMAGLHGTIDGLARLQERHPDRFAVEHLDQVAKIVTQHTKAGYEHGGWKAPPPEQPMTSTAAQMSVQYAAAAQLLEGEVLMTQYSDARLNRPILRNLMTKVHPTHDPKLDEKEATRQTTRITVTFTDSDEALEEEVRAPRGVNPPVSNDEIVQKWRSLVCGVIDDARRDEIERQVLHLETLSDVRSLIKLLSGRTTCPIEA